MKRTFHLDAWARRTAFEAANRFENEKLRYSVYRQERIKLVNAIWSPAELVPFDYLLNESPTQGIDEEFYIIRPVYTFMEGIADLSSFHRKMSLWKNSNGQKRLACTVFRFP